MPWLLLAWSCAALALAASRVPYDDEWFSLELAFRATPEQLWRALEHDVHPPWLALLDRALAQLTAAELSLNAVRIAAAAAAIALVARTLAGRFELPRWAFVLAAAHPIVLFYAGSARWYPFLLLAHSLRAYAIWHAEALRTRHGAAFASGAVLGSIATYLDPLFLAHDCGWLIARHRPRLRSAAIATGGVIGVVALRFVSPLETRVHSPLWRETPVFDPTDLMSWAGLGLTGEAGLPFPWLLAGALWVLVATVWAMLRAPRDQTLAWLATYAGAWCIACFFGIWHPRYSLLLWILAGALLVQLARRGSRLARISAGVALAQLALVLALTFTARAFFKADLNRLVDGDCAAVEAVHVPLLIVPYPRLAALVERQCAVRAAILVVPSIRIIPGEREQLAAVRARLAEVSDAALLSLRAESSLTDTQQRVQSLLERACRPEAARTFGVAPHEFPRSDRPPNYRRFQLQRFRCGS